MSAQPIGEAGHAEQHKRQHGVVAQPTPVQQQRIGSLVDHESGSRNDEEAAQRSSDRDTIAAESPAAMSGVRKAESHEPANDIGRHWLPAGPADQRDDHSPVHQRSEAADHDEPVETGTSGGRLRETRRKGRLHGETDDSPLRAVCIALDDYGLHSGINQAALLLAEAGRVQGIGCMVGGNAWPQWSRALVQLDHYCPDWRGFDLGLHLDLTETASAPFGARPLRRLMFECWSRQINRPTLRAEIRRQLDIFEQAIGRQPDYVDGHQHVHQFPVVRSELIDELCRRYGANPPWLRSTRRPTLSLSPSSPLSQPFNLDLKARMIEGLGARSLAVLAQSAGLRQNRALLGVRGFSAGAQAYANHLRRWLAEASTADLLMCHPSLAFDGDDSIISARLVEFEVLSGAAFGQWLVAERIVLRPMSWILASDGVRDPC